VRAYIAAHKDGNATATDLTHAISRATDADLGPAFATFLDQPGAPEITARLICERGEPPRVELGQHRYVPPGAPTRRGGKPWIMPVCVAYDRGGRRAQSCTMVEAASATLALDAPACPRWLIANAGGRGYYRVAYSPADVMAVRDHAWPFLTPVERRAVMFDVNAAADLGALPLSLALSFVPRLIAAVRA
jgi:alanyl aminopeptidase